MVNPATVTVMANNASRAVGAANPTFTASYSGFVNGDTAATVLSGSPVLSTTATTSSPAGTYPITVAAGTLTASGNYLINYVNGTLSVIQAPTVVLTTTATLAGSAAAGYTATVTVKNTGTGPATNLTLTVATLGTANGTPLPQTWGTIAAGGSGTFTVHFPGSAGANGAGVVEKYSGTSTEASFTSSIRAVLP
jgi:uncharacterized membrane protein